MEDKKPIGSGGDNSSAAETIVDVSHKLKNPILTEADLRRLASTFAVRSFANRRFNSGIVKFSRVYALNKPWSKYLLCIALGLLMSLATFFLVETTGLYTGGFSACFQGIARLVYAKMMLTAIGREHAENMANMVYNALFWGLYVCLNVPLTIFAYKKINKSFAKMSIVYLIVLQGMGFVWGMIPDFRDVHIFGDTSTVNAYLNSYHIQSILFAPKWFPQFGPGMPYNIDNPAAWDPPISADDKNIVHSVVTDVTVENITKVVLLLVYSVVFSLISALCYTLMFILGGSTAGSDYLTIYWSQEKNKNVGGIFIIITSVSMIAGITMGTYGAGALVGEDVHVNYATWQYFFSANLVTSLIWVFLNGFLIDKWFPWHKLVRVEIYSAKVEHINRYLKAVKYTHPTTMLEATGGYSGQPTKMLLSVCMVVELPKLIHYVRTIDQKCLISSSYIADIDGEMAMQRQTY